MQALFFLLALAAGSVLLLTLFLNASPAAMARGARYGLGTFLVGVAAMLLAFRQVGWAFPIGAAGLMILMRGGLFGGGSRSRGGTSSVRSAGLEMILDHDTGSMDGRVLAGRFEGQMLSDMPLSDLLDLAVDFSGDPESLRLLEGYLDSRHPGWREDVESDGTTGHRPAPGASGMTSQEAHEILGVEPGASAAEIREAHRRLIKQVHPDRGGSDALAAKINEAKDKLLGRH